MSTTPARHQPIEWTVSTRTIIRILVIATLFLGLINITLLLSNQIAWVGISFFFAMALTPAVNWLSRFMPRKSRGLAMGLVLITTIALLAYLLLVLVPPLIVQLSNLIQNFPRYWADFLSSNTVLARYAQELNLADLASKNQDKIADVLTNASGWLGGAASGLFALVTIFTLTFFMVIEGPRWVAIFWRYQPPAKRAEYQALANSMYQTVTGYIGGNFFTSVVATVCTAIFLAVMGIPSPIALGLLVGLLDLIPMIGATLAAVVVSLFVLVFSGSGAGIITVIFFIVYQQIENNLLAPLVYAKSINISPLVVGIAAVCGGALAGFVGALVAIPAAASIQLLVRHYLEKNYRNHYASSK